MGKIVLSTNVSLDGVVQDPDGAEGFDRGGWFTRALDADRSAWAEIEFEEAMQATALLLGRRSDAWFAERWTSRSGGWADRLNDLPKYVVSSTLQPPRWTNATVVSGDVLAGVAKLKRDLAGDIVVYASYQLDRLLLENGLVDELRLFIFPVVVGAGERLFGRTDRPTSLRLVSSRTVGSGLVMVTYRIQAVRRESVLSAEVTRSAVAAGAG